MEVESLESPRIDRSVEAAELVTCEHQEPPNLNARELSTASDERPTQENDHMVVDATSDEGKSDGMDADGFPMIEVPSENILVRAKSKLTALVARIEAHCLAQEDFETALKTDSDFQGTFAFTKTYDDAPNPILCLEGLGTVGLPLSEREAKVVIEKSIQAPFGKGERTIVDTEVRDTWEMDASQVQFQEPKWQSFMNRVVQEVCQTLGVNFQASKPRAELYKLLIYETGSHFLPHVDTEKTNGMFASIIVVLPSRFTGGDAHVSHGTLKKVFNTSEPSLSKTTVLSWYTDVTHEIKPIQSGYRLALSYNLFHTTTSLRPSLSSQNDIVGRLRHILLSWKQRESKPDKIIYMLDHKYSQASLSASALKGKDAHIVAVLDSLSKEIGFSLGLAHIEHHETGQANDYGGGRGSYWDESEEDDDDVEMGEIEERTTTIENLVDLDGEDISDTVEFDDEAETIPARFDRYFEGQSCDDEEYEGYQGNCGGNLERFYRRTALVIWPRWTRLGDEEGDARTVSALETLRELDGSDPTAEDLKLFDWVCRSSGYKRHSRTLETLCNVALEWEKAELWVTAITTTRDECLTHMVPIDELASAITQFGYTEISMGLNEIILSDQSVTSRLNYLSRLETCAHNQQDDPSFSLVLLFVRELRLFTFDNLQWVDVSELCFLTNQVMKHDGIERLKTRSSYFHRPSASRCSFKHDSILPRLRKEPVDVGVLQPYAAYLHQETQQLAPSIADQSRLREIVTESLTTVLDRLDLFRVETISPPRYHYSYQQSNPGKPTLKGDPAPAMTFIAQCLESGNGTIAIAALKRMMNMTGQTQDVMQARATTVLLPLLQALSKEPKAQPSLRDFPLASLSEVAIPLALQSIEANGGTFSQETICALLDGIVVAGTPQLLTTAILPKIRSLKWDETSWKLCIEQLHSRRGVLSSTQDSVSAITAVVSEMANLYAQKVTLPTATQQTSGYSYYGIRGNSSAGILAILDTCLKLGGIQALEVVLKRVLEPKMTSEYLQNYLVPLLPGICQLAQREGVAVSCQPFSSAIQIIMNYWAILVLGTKPDEVLYQRLLAKVQGYTCTLPNCVAVRRFLTTPNAERSMKLERIGAPARKHVEKELQTHAVGAATFDTIRSSPQGLTVSKHDGLFQPARWRATQQEGVKLLKEIGNEGVLRAIWSNEYAAFINKMNGITTNSNTNQTISPHTRFNPYSGATTTMAGPSQTQQPARLNVSSVTTLAGARARQQPMPRVGTTTAAASRALPAGSSAPAVTPAKRKFDAVIDLTDSD
ncbi:hypothetical protein PM082_019807 [Marasmius tenuissimus]|nr:hypothetical protein PM082_019807 [Marasmius tenuissimus]